MRNLVRWAMILSLLQALSLASAQDSGSLQSRGLSNAWSTHTGERKSACEKPRDRTRRAAARAKQKAGQAGKQAKGALKDAKDEAKSTFQKIINWFRDLFDRVLAQLRKIWQSLKSKGGGSRKGGDDEDDYLEDE